MPHNDILLCSIAGLLGLTAATIRNNIATLSFALYSAYLLSILVHRLLFHPLANIPGPKVAAATYLYEFYYDLIKPPGRQYFRKLEDLHKQYGPILRIGPDEVQVSDPEFVDKVYVSGSSKRHRWPRAGTGKFSPGALSSANAHDHHRLRRNSLNNFFSKAAISRMQSKLQEVMDPLEHDFEVALKNGEILNVNDTASTMTLNFITQYVFGKTWEGESDSFIKAMREGFTALSIFKFFSLLQSIPRSILETLVPVSKVISKWENKCEEEVSRVKADRLEGEVSGVTTLTSVLLDSQLPEPEKDTIRLRDEAVILVTAGTETTASTIANLVYYVLSSPAILKTLQQELDAAFPHGNEDISLSKAEQLPYLTAALKETHRVIAILTARSLLVAEEPVQYKQWTIPPGTAMCVNFRAALHDPVAFPDPTKFDPSRWLGNSEAVQLRNKYFIPFSRGHRNCLGMNLAWAELYLASAIIFRKFELKLHAVEFERDVRITRDCFVGMASPDSKGVRVEVIGRRV